MQRIAAKLALLVALLVATVSSAFAMPYRVDPAHTEIAFEIGAKGYPLTHGVFRSFTSQLTIDLDHPQRSSVRFNVASASLDTRAPALDAYVRGPAFLNADAHPDIRFTSTAVEKLDDHTVRVTGNLTMLGVTRTETFTVEVQRGPGAAFAFRVEGAVKRSQYGMTAGLPLISDDVRIIVATRAEET